MHIIDGNRINELVAATVLDTPAAKSRDKRKFRSFTVIPVIQQIGSTVQARVTANMSPEAAAMFQDLRGMV